MAPGFDQASDPCNGAPPSNGGGAPVPSTGFVFERSDTDEYRWVLGTQNVWISESCAASLGGATQTGTWVDLNVIAPEFDAAADPCSGGVAPPAGNGAGNSGGYVFSRTDTTEYRWVTGTENVWISESCAASLGGATQSGTWSDLNAVAPDFDAASSPCS